MPKIRLIATLVMTVVFFTSCSQGNNGKTNRDQVNESIPTKQMEPVTIKVNFTDALKQVFQKYVEPALQRKMPYITLEYVSGKWEDLIAAGQTPDIIMPNGSLYTAMDLHLQTDLTDLIKKHSYDLSRIDQSLISSIRKYGPNGELYALPASKGAVVLLFNKDIFDKFGVSYPKGRMYWDDIYELAKKLTRTVDGRSYKGFNMDGVGMLADQMGVGYYDPKNKATFVKDEGWKKVLETWAKFNTLPGNKPTKGARPSFSEDMDTAMIVTQVSYLIRNPVAGLNYDMVESPTFENNRRSNGLGTMFVIPPTSNHKDDAFEVIKLFHSDEVQTAITRDAALFTELNNSDIQKQFGANDPVLQKYNLQANFKVDQAVKVVDKYEGEGSKVINSELPSILKGDLDINTALRKAEEALNQKVAQLESK